jgi:hypothetical protein
LKGLYKRLERAKRCNFLAHLKRSSPFLLSKCRRDLSENVIGAPGVVPRAGSRLGGGVRIVTLSAWSQLLLELQVIPTATVAG